MEASNFDLKGFLNDPAAQADKAGAIQFLQQKGIIDAQGKVIPGMIKEDTPTQSAPSGTPGSPGSQFPTGMGSFSALKSNVAAVPGALMGAGKAAVNAVTGAEQGFGKEIAAAVGAPEAQKQADALNMQHQNTTTQAMKLSQQLKAAGKDSSKIDSIITNLRSAPLHTVGDVLPSVNDSTGQVLGNAAGVAADALGAGIYGKAAKAMETGALAKPLVASVPTAISAAKTGINAVTQGVDKAPAIAQKAFLGKEGVKTLGQLNNTEAKAFIPIEQGGAGKTFSSVVDTTQKAVNSFVSKSKADLQAVKQAIPENIHVGKDKITNTVNDAIIKSVQNNADYKGVKGDVKYLFKDVGEVVNSGLLNTEEVARVKGMESAVKNWTDNSARGVLNLKEQLAPFYKEGLSGSNKILSNIQNGLKNIVGEVHPAIKPALAKASANIDKAEEFSTHLLGTNPATGESKLITLAKNLKNPALKGYQNTLLDELKSATGHDITPQLKGYADYLDLLGKDFPSKTRTVVKSLVTSPVAKTAGAIGTVGFVGEGLKKIGL